MKEGWKRDQGMYCSGPQSPLHPRRSFNFQEQQQQAKMLLMARDWWCLIALRVLIFYPKGMPKKERTLLSTKSYAFSSSLHNSSNVLHEKMHYESFAESCNYCQWNLWSIVFQQGVYIKTTSCVFLLDLTDCPSLHVYWCWIYKCKNYYTWSEYMFIHWFFSFLYSSAANSG